MPQNEIASGWNGKGPIPFLDGLRAYSILNVLFAHCIEYGHAARLIPWLASRSAAPFLVVFANGILGVRVFFVLSGFLITSLLLDELDTTGRISISGFYGRRIARIFPAAYSYILALIVLVALRLLELPWQPLLAASTYTWNYTALGGTPAGLVLGHFWTLSLEEQFYLVWPTLLFLIGSRWAKRFALTCVVLFPIAREIILHFVPTARWNIMLMFHTSADQIMWGAVAAFAYKGGALERLRSVRYRYLIPWLCILLVFVFCPLMERRFWNAPVLVTPSVQGISVVLFIFWLLAGNGGPVRWMLGSWPAVQLGLLSYSIYIWQQLFLVWPGTSWLKFPLNLLAAIAAGAASYRLIEVPMRKRIRQWFSQPPPAH